MYINEKPKEGKKGLSLKSLTIFIVLTWICLVLILSFPFLRNCSDVTLKEATEKRLVNALIQLEELKDEIIEMNDLLANITR